MKTASKVKSVPKKPPVRSSVRLPKKRFGMGRPPKFDNVEELEKCIDKYFRSCWKQKIDMFGNPIYLKDKKGKKTDKKVMQQWRPYTMSGLALALGMDRKTLYNYSKDDTFFPTIKSAKQVCQAYAEESLFTGKNPTGAMFNLKNNYEDWKDKQDTEHSGNITWVVNPPK